VPALASSVAGNAPRGGRLLSRCQYPAASGPEEIVIGDRLVSGGPVDLVTALPCRLT
jgi:hypothetical protein